MSEGFGDGSHRVIRCCNALGGSVSSLRCCDLPARSRTIDTERGLRKKVPPMRVIAARFREWSRAQAALAALRARFGLRGDQAEAAVLASEGTGRPAVVAGQIPQERIPQDANMITHPEGGIVADVPTGGNEI